MIRAAISTITVRLKGRETAGLQEPYGLSLFTVYTSIKFGAWGSVVVKALRYKSEGPGIDSKLGIYSVAADISLCPEVDSASKNEYQDIPRGKGGQCVRVTTLPPSCAECLEIWDLNRPEPSRPHRPVIGIALPFYIHVYVQNTVYGMSW